jgi:hypothetical protein
MTLAPTVLSRITPRPAWRVLQPYEHLKRLPLLGGFLSTTIPMIFRFILSSAGHLLHRSRFPGAQRDAAVHVAAVETHGPRQFRIRSAAHRSRDLQPLTCVLNVPLAATRRSKTCPLAHTPPVNAAGAIGLDSGQSSSACHGKRNEKSPLLRLRCSRGRPASSLPWPGTGEDNQDSACRPLLQDLTCSQHRGAAFLHGYPAASARYR